MKKLSLIFILLSNGLYAANQGKTLSLFNVPKTTAADRVCQLITWSASNLSFLTADNFKFYGLATSALVALKINDVVEAKNIKNFANQIITKEKQIVVEEIQKAEQEIQHSLNYILNPQTSDRAALFIKTEKASLEKAIKEDDNKKINEILTSIKEQFDRLYRTRHKEKATEIKTLVKKRQNFLRQEVIDKLSAEYLFYTSSTIEKIIRQIERLRQTEKQIEEQIETTIETAEEEAIKKRKRNIYSYILPPKYIFNVY